MSYKIIDQIKKTRALAGRHKRVLEAWASYGDKDGTNIYCSKDSVAARASVSRDTVYRNTAELAAMGILVPAASHACKVPGCNRGRTHFTGTHGSYTLAYNIGVERLTFLQNAERQVSAKCLKVNSAKSIKVPLGKIRHYPTHETFDPAQGDPSALRAGVSEQVSESPTVVAPLLPTGAEEPTFENRDDRQWLSAEDLYHRMFPSKIWSDEDIRLLIALAEEIGGPKGLTWGGERVKAAWEWNQAHKKGKYRLFTLPELANALRSTNGRSLLAQMDADTGCPLCQ